MKSVVLSFFIALGVFAANESAPFLQKKSVVIPNHFCGIIYTWSPGMPMSEKGLREIQDYAKDNGLLMRAVVDPQLKNMPQEFQLRDKSNKQYPAYKVMAEVGYFNHFPGYFVQDATGTIKPLRLGYIFPEDLKTFLDATEIQGLCK